MKTNQPNNNFDIGAMFEDDPVAAPETQAVDAASAPSTGNIVTFVLDKDVTKFERLLANYTATAGSLVIRNAAEYDAAAKMVSDIANASKDIADLWEDERKRSHELWKGIVEKINRFTSPLSGLRSTIEGKMRAYKLAEEAKKRQALIEEDRRRQAILDAERREAQRLLEEGRVREAQAREREAAQVAAMPVELPPTPKSAHVSDRKTWKFTVTDPLALLKAVADGTVPFLHELIIKGKGEQKPLFEVSETVLRHYCALRGDKLDWPGVVVEPDISFTNKGRR